MTHTVCTQSKPSLSVRTRALTSKFHTKLASKRALLSASVSLRLRHQNSNAERSHLRRCHVILNADACLSDVKLSTGDNSLSDQSVINSVQDTSASSISSASSGSNGQSVCRWKDCECSDIERTQLVNHIQQIHVLPQLSSRRKYFCCLWQDCRVYGRPSVSAAWLEQHILHHTDAKGKPFRCIFDSCLLRFSTSTLLERHVQRTHMRTNRTKKESFSDGSTADKQMCRPRSKEVTSLQSSTKQSSSSVPIKKNLPRRKKARTYRVRRVDFYDYRSQIVIKNRLRIPYLLNRELATETNNGSAHILPLKMCDLPSKLCEKSFKPRLRTHGNSPNSGVDKEFDLSLLLKNTKDVHQHISLLLTTPHTFVGQRLSQDGRCEFLIRWIHGSGQNTIPPTWISEEELQMAAHLDYSL